VASNTLRGDPYYALSELENSKGVNFMTQAVGLWALT
jgi:hypothetical protein